MKKQLVLLSLLLMMVAVVSEARTVADLFGSEPGQVFGLLPRTVRLDMVDYYRSGQTVAARNNMGGDSQFESMDSVYLRLRSSASTIVEMRLLASKRDTIIMVITTVQTPVADSRITFWDTEWHPLRASKLFHAPQMDDFIKSDMPEQLRADLQAVMNFPLIEMRLEGECHDKLVARHGLQEFLVPTDYHRFEPYLLPSLTYHINGTKIKSVK